MWQIDLWRKRGLGLLSKSFGPSFVDQDRAARMFVYRGDIKKEWTATLPEGLDPCVIPEDVLADCELATQNVKFDMPDDAEEDKANPDGETKKKQGASRDPARFLRTASANVHEIGSNNWTIAPQRSNTGRPILANDPHRSHGVPSLRYVVHLNSPNMLGHRGRGAGTSRDLNWS